MKRHLLIALFTLMATPAFSAGVLSFTPNPATYGALPGGTVLIGATLSNTGDSTLYLNDRSLTFNGSAATYLHANTFFNFFNSVPGTFDTTDAPFNGTIAEILIDSNTPPGTYTITIQMIGGASPALTNPSTDGIGTQTFAIAVGPPSAPSNLIATSLAAGNVAVTWTDNSASETRFELALDDSLAVVKTVGADVATASFTGLDSATSYHFYVRACNAPGCSSWVGPVVKVANGIDDPTTPVLNPLSDTPSGISQSIAPYQGGPFVLNVNGANFDAGAVVSIGGISLSTTRVGSTQLTAQVTSTLLTTVGSKAVIITNGGGKTSTSVNFKVVVRGDTNGSGGVNVGDALVCAQTVGGLIKPALAISVGDQNLNGSSDIGDCLMTALFAGRLNPNFIIPAIASISPSTAEPGNSLTIMGTGFAPIGANNQVLFTTATGVVRVTAASGNSSSLTVTVPAAAVTGPMQVYRVDNGLAGAEFPATVSGSSPSLLLTAVQPYFQLIPGSSVALTGMAFSALPAGNSVLFKTASGTVGATVTDASATSLTVTVPAGAVCGPVVVKVVSQTSNARAVTLAGPAPCGLQLIDIWGGGSPGDVVVLEGTGFDVVTPANNVVQFASATGTVIAPVIAAGGTQLHVRIPATAIQGNVTVTVNASTSNPLTYVP
jgi:hypothetical protein